MVKSFSLGAKKYRVKRVSDRGTVLGTAYSPLGLITIQTKFDGKDIPEDSIEQTFFHELVHCILDDIGEPGKSQNEQFVQAFSVLLHQFYKTAKC